MTDKLVGCHPELVLKVRRVLAAMEALGFPMLVTDGLRTVEQQARLYAQGRAIPGPIVTHADGVATRSNHQVHSDGMGHAADCAFVVNGQPSWNVALPWKTYGACAEALGLKWGGEWDRLVDLPHVELP